MDAAHADSEGGRSRAWWDALSCIPVRTRVAQGQGHTGMGVGNSLLPAARGGMEAQRKGSGRIFFGPASDLWMQHCLECPDGEWRAGQSLGYPGEPRDQRECAEAGEGDPL